MDACTVTTLDVITAFAVPNLNCSSQSQSIFSGLVALQVTLPSGSLSLLRIGNFLISPTLSAVDEAKVTCRGEMSTPANGATRLSFRWISHFVNS